MQKVATFSDMISPLDRILDLGGGHDAHPWASVVVDFYLTDDEQRDGQPLPPTLLDNDRYQLVVWDLNTYPWPFADGEFDFVLASHILEHLDDPLAACREMMRVGRRGYVECPNPFYEQVYGSKFHKWLVETEGGALAFTNLREEDRGFLGEWFREQVRDPQSPARQLHDAHRDRLITAFAWEGTFEVRVRWRPEGSDVRP